MPEKTQHRRRRLSERPAQPPPPLLSASKNAPRNGRNFDQDLFKNLVDIVPLVESLVEPRANPSFRRRASMAVTAAPNPKVPDPKGKKTAEVVSEVKQRDHAGNASNRHSQNQDSNADNFSMFSSRALREEDVQKDMQELTMMREQLDDLHKILSEKDEALKSAEETRNQMSTMQVSPAELRRKVAEMELLVTSTNSQISNAKIKLAERQEALEKLQCEASTSNKKLQELQGDLESMDFEKFAFMLLFQELSKNDSSAYSEQNITTFQQFDNLPHIDNMSSDTELRQMEEARVAYIAAVAVARENPTVETLAAAAEARRKLEAFVF